MHFGSLFDDGNSKDEQGDWGEFRVKNKILRIKDKLGECYLYNDIYIEVKGHIYQIDHIEIRENGIFCIETKNYIGWIFGSESQEKWTQTLYTGEKHQFFNPLKQNKSHCYHISKVIGKKYRVNSLVVMANNNADKIKCSNVINLDNLKSYLKKFDNGVRLSTEEMDTIYKKLKDASSGMTNKEHIQNIRNTQKELKQNICPRCGGTLVLRKGTSGSFYGCSNYPKCKFTKKV